MRWKHNVLLVLDFQVFTQVIDVHLKIVYDECSSCNVGHEVVNIPAGHVVVSKRVSEDKMTELSDLL